MVKYFVLIKNNNEWKKYIPYILSNGVWKPSRAYVNTGSTGGWKPCGEIPTEDGYTHVTIVDTQNFTIPNHDYEVTPDNDYDWIINLTGNSAFTSTITSNEDWLEFINNCKRIRVIYDGTIVEDRIMTENEKYPIWQGSEIGFDTSIIYWAFYGSYYNNNFRFSVGNYDWNSEYNGTTHSVKIEALM